MKIILHNKALIPLTKIPSDLKLHIDCQTSFQIDKSDPIFACIYIYIHTVSDAPLKLKRLYKPNYIIFSTEMKISTLT